MLNAKRRVALIAAVHTEYTAHTEQTNTPIVNDPTAGSPTITLLRLLVLLNDQVRGTLRRPRKGTALQTPH